MYCRIVTVTEDVKWRYLKGLERSVDLHSSIPNLLQEVYGLQKSVIIIRFDWSGKHVPAIVKELFQSVQAKNHPIYIRLRSNYSRRQSDLPVLNMLEQVCLYSVRPLGDCVENSMFQGLQVDFQPLLEDNVVRTLIDLVQELDVSVQFVLKIVEIGLLLGYVWYFFRVVCLGDPLFLVVAENAPEAHKQDQVLETIVQPQPRVRSKFLKKVSVNFLL